jgi:hypothetical protein
MTTKHAPVETWVLTFVPAPGYAAPMATRVKRLLKTALRAFGLRCIRHARPALEETAGDKENSP